MAGVLHDVGGTLERGRYCHNNQPDTTHPTTHTHTHTIFQPGDPRKVSIVPVCPSGAMRREEGRSQLVPVVFLRFP